MRLTCGQSITSSQMKRNFEPTKTTQRALAQAKCAQIKLIWLKLGELPEHCSTRRILDLPSPGFSGNSLRSGLLIGASCVCFSFSGTVPVFPVLEGLHPAVWPFPVPRPWFNLWNQALIVPSKHIPAGFSAFSRVVGFMSKKSSTLDKQKQKKREKQTNKEKKKSRVKVPASDPSATQRAALQGSNRSPSPAISTNRRRGSPASPSAGKVVCWGKAQLEEEEEEEKWAAGNIIEAATRRFGGND